MTKRMLGFILTAAMLITMLAPAGYAAEDNHPMLDLQTEENQALEKPSEASELRREEAAQKLKEWESGLSERYIVKRTPSLVFQAELAEAFASGKAAMEQELSDVLEEAGAPTVTALIQQSGLSEAGSRLRTAAGKIKSQKAVTAEPQLQALPGNKELITLPEKVESEAFMQRLQQQLGDSIEYIQPDYELSLAEYQTKQGSPPAETPGDPAENILKNGSPQPELSQNAGLLLGGDADAAPEPAPSADPEIPESDETPSPSPTAMPENVIVAIIDSGIDVTHPDLTGHVTAGYDFYHDTAEIEIDYSSKADTHGTHIAGLIAANAPDVKIMPLKAFHDGQARTSDLIEAIDYAKENGATVVNCSWGSSDDNQALKEVMEASGLLFVCAAGNNGRNIDESPVYPASFDLDNVISVAAVESDYRISYFSNYGQQVDLTAPGENVSSTVLGGGYGQMSGTSVSAGYVSAVLGTAANGSNAELKERLLSGCDKVSCLEAQVRDGNFLNAGNFAQNAPGQILEIEPEAPSYASGRNIPKKEFWELYASGYVDYQITKIMKTPEYALYLMPNAELCLENLKKHTASIVCENVEDFCGGTILKKDGNVIEMVYASVDDYEFTDRLMSGSAAKIAGIETHLVLTNDGKVWAWGPNMYGTAGRADPLFWDDYFIGFDEVKQPQLIELYGQDSTLSNVISISESHYNGFAITSNHDLYYWGCNHRYTGTEYSDPYAKKIYSGVRDVMGWGENVFIVKENGSSVMLNLEEDPNEFYAEEHTITNFNNVDRFFGDNLFVKQDGTVYNFNRIYSSGYDPDTITCTRFKNLSDVYYIYNHLLDDEYGCLVMNDGTAYYWDNTHTYSKFDQYYDLMVGSIDFEIYNDEAQVGQSGLEAIGWSEDGPHRNNGDFSAESGQLVLRKTSPAVSGDISPAYEVSKIFTDRLEGYGGDPRVTMWTNHFKGEYELRIDGAFHNAGSQIYLDILGFDAAGAAVNTGRFCIDSPNSTFGVCNNGLNQTGVTFYPLWENADSNHFFSTTFQSLNSTYWVHEPNTLNPIKTTVSGASPKGEFNMTDWNERAPGAYITGIKFNVQNKMPANTEFVKLNGLRLLERYKEPDTAVESAVEQLTMSTLTNTPGAVTSNLKTLPVSKPGVSITWRSSRPDLISNTGTLVSAPAFATDVIMTASVRNTEDGYTQNLDFRLTVPKQGGFEETYTGSYTGTASGYGGEGTKTFAQLPAWKFTYPGIRNGTNGQLHAGQALVKNGYLTLKKVSDRQTENSEACIAGTRPLSGSEAMPLLKSGTIGLTARADGGTARYTLLTAEGNPACTLILDAEQNVVKFVYGETESGQATTKTEQCGSISPTADHNYELFLSAGHTVSLSVDGEPVSANRGFMPGAGEAPLISKLEASIDNNAGQNREVGKLKRLVVSNPQMETNANVKAVWNDIEALRAALPETAEGNLTLPITGTVSGSKIVWTSGAPQCIAADGTVNKPAWYQADQKVTLTAAVSKGTASKSVSFTVTVPHQAPDSQRYVYTTDDTMISGGTPGLVGTERYGWNPAAVVDSSIVNQKLAGSYAMLKFDFSDCDTSDLTYAQLELTQLSGSRGSKYKVAVLENNSFNGSWQQNRVTYPDVPAVLSNLTEIGEITLVRTNTEAQARASISIPITELVQSVKEQETDSQIVTLIIYSADDQASALKLAMSEWEGIAQPGSYRPRICLNRASDTTGEYEADVPVRTLGREYEQTYSLAADTQKPEILQVSEKIIDGEKGIYEFSISDGQYTADPSANPFFFWSAMEGTFAAISPDYRRVRFTIDPKSKGRQVKVIAGMGDGLGYVDRKAIYVGMEEPGFASLASFQALSPGLAENQIEQAMVNSLPENAVIEPAELAIGLDLSLDMLPFDPGAGLLWLEVIDGMMESAPEGTAYQITDGTNHETYASTEAAMAGLATIRQTGYSGQDYTEALLEAWSAQLSGSDSRNKMAVLFVNQSIDAAALEKAVQAMRRQGTAVMVLALGTENADNSPLARIPGVYPVNSMLELRLKVSDIYGSFSEMKTRAVSAPQISLFSLPAVDDRYLPFTSDLKGRYIFDIESADGKQFGVSLASVLNIYSCLPAMAVRGGDSYDLFSNGQNVYSLMKGSAADMDASTLDSMFSFYEKFKSAMESDSTGLVKTGKVHDDAVKEVILKNLKRRFPVLLVRNGSTAVITGYHQENGAEKFNLYTYGQDAQEGISLTDDNCWVLDTFAYLLEISKEFNVSDRIDTGESFYENIRFTYPDGYDSSKIKAFKYDKSNSSLTAQDITFDTDNDIAKIGSPADGSCILAGLKTEYKGILPNLYGANKLYQVIQYEDLQEKIGDPWYYLYLFQATNRGIINGDIDENGVVNFNPQGDVTRAQFLKMVIEAAGIDTGGVIDSPDVHWAKNYLDYALRIGLIDQTQYQDPDANLPRCEAAYILSAMFINKAAALQVPSLIYKYHTEIFTPKNVAWLEGSAFVDQGESNFYNADEVYQMYMNGVMEGDENHYFHPIADITRAEVCKAVMKCMFDLSADIKAAEVVFEGYTNFAEFDHEYTKPTSGWKDYHFNAERSGYYFVGVKGGNMTAHVDECSGGGTGGGLRYSRLTDDFTETYQSFGEGVPDYIANNMTKDGYTYRRFYLEKGTSFRVSGLQGNHTAFQVLAPKDGDIAFREAGGGKFIFSNNIEGIDKASTADNGDNSHMIMQVKDLQPDKYTFMAWHMNEARDSLDELGNVVNGKNLYVDVQLRANATTTIHFTSLGIQLPDEDMPDTSDNTIYDRDWTSTQAFANYGKTAIGGRTAYNGNSAQTAKYCGESYQNFDVTVTLEADQSIWLQDLYNDYIGGVYPKLTCRPQNPIYIIMDFEVINGSVDFNEMAYADKANIVDFYSPAFAGAVAPYRWDTMTKGVADTRPEVIAEVNYTLDENSNGTLPAKLFNSYNPRGKEAQFWFTHLNPQTDAFIHPFKQVGNLYATRDISAESDIVKMKYKDASKIDAYEQYGTVPTGEKADTWYFDVFHTLCKDPQYQLVNKINDPIEDELGAAPEAVSGFVPNSLLPRLDTQIRIDEIVSIAGQNYIRMPSSFKLSGGGGNYSVYTTYDFKFTNTGSVDKKVDYHLFSWQNNVIRVENVHTGEVQLFSMGERTPDAVSTPEASLALDEKMDYVIASMNVPANSEAEYKVSVVLVTANPGGIKQYLTVSDQ